MQSGLLSACTVKSWYVYKHSYWSWWAFSSDLEQRKSIVQGVWSKFCHQIVNTLKSCQHKTCNMNGQSDGLKWMWAERATKKFMQSTWQCRIVNFPLCNEVTQGVQKQKDNQKTQREWGDAILSYERQNVVD